MRMGLSTIQQTLTPEAAGVLNQSIAEAARRSHSQTTPLHVAATLLASTCGLLRQACVHSHPNSSHPLQCRALKLCFSVALDRLPSYSGGSGAGGGGNGVVKQPPISNALMAALKRAQAHQRRGCPEQQQQPLLAVKVELEQLILSILASQHGKGISTRQSGRPASAARSTAGRNRAAFRGVLTTVASHHSPRSGLSDGPMGLTRSRVLRSFDGPT